MRFEGREILRLGDWETRRGEGEMVRRGDLGAAKVERTIFFLAD